MRHSVKRIQRALKWCRRFPATHAYSRMARLPRFRLPDQPQQVIVRGNDRAAIFHDDADYRHLYSILVAAMERF